ncbi:MAG: hypothetical protein A4E34_02197 [Methanoregula sp. PtaU1.Bin006]|uniref:hypothetical protein n=1 Tax=Methanoregula sp. PtaU1.Bin006 TaxID=1811681 RepID=UPI0009C7C395|nr:hypothetical protein [Methanoregula sp. PtaU1.Bin006]OPY32820.1 MAG: hypothetical protein A4E34_02197 [Methanoregula sp. PtaU1.Bin006]
MTASLWRSLTARFMVLGHPLREAECMAAAVVIDCLAILTIMGYRSGDAERERLPVIDTMGPETPDTIACGHCGTAPGSVDRDGMLLHCRPEPALPAGCGEYDGISGGRRISSAAAGTAAMVCW